MGKVKLNFLCQYWFSNNREQIATLEREVFLIGVTAGYQEEVTLSLTLKLNQKGYTNS